MGMDIDLKNVHLMDMHRTKIEKKTENIKEKTAKEKELKKACEGFESILVHTLIKSMRESLPGNALFDESHGMNIYQSMHDEYLADELSRSHFSTGIKEFLYQELKDSI
ncbi:MAG: rod-binding protein [Proteobacteria bacterium]|nr:rod-binding protein [Pseudomonadota bacterium]MBU1388932.1 rod-binding protein [Pseudomonadota bacterium]MBU1543484.1 rod-binding protein [Pseudomonadota bacterium]MBU2430142.1 rod-binding protein [Pseudomonadota bacterium]